MSERQMDQMEGRLLAVEAALQILLEKGLPGIRHKGDLIPLRDKASEVIEPRLKHRSPTCNASARATIDTLFGAVPEEASD